MAPAVRDNAVVNSITSRSGPRRGGGPHLTIACACPNGVSLQSSDIGVMRRRHRSPRVHVPLSHCTPGRPACGDVTGDRPGSGPAPTGSVEGAPGQAGVSAAEPARSQGAGPARDRPPRRSVARGGHLAPEVGRRVQGAAVERSPLAHRPPRPLVRRGRTGGAAAGRPGFGFDVERAVGHLAAAEPDFPAAQPPGREADDLSQLPRRGADEQRLEQRRQHDHRIAVRHRRLPVFVHHCRVGAHPVHLAAGGRGLRAFRRERHHRAAGGRTADAQPVDRPVLAPRC